MSLKTTMEAVEASSKLVNICEQGPAASTKMPRTIQLVKQLKKELNMQKILMKEKQKRGSKCFSTPELLVFRHYLLIVIYGWLLYRGGLLIQLYRGGLLIQLY